MRPPKLRAVEHSFDWEDGSKPDKWRMPNAGVGWSAFCTVYGQLDRSRARELMVPLVWAYNEGRYEVALGYISAVIKEEPEAERQLGIHAWLCRRVLALELDETDLATRERQERRTRGLRRLVGGTAELRIRCKWCGHLTPYIPPNEGFAYLGGNSCDRCGSGYPAPDFGWDSMQGMAYSAGRGSWGEWSTPKRLWNEYFDEFERRFQPGHKDAG